MNFVVVDADHDFENPLRRRKKLTLRKPFLDALASLDFKLKVSDSSFFKYSMIINDNV